MAAKNKVLTGAYEQKDIDIKNGLAGILVDKMFFTKETVEAYEIITQTTQKSTASAMGRAAVGAMVLGPLGMMAGFTAKNQQVYTLSIQFKDGRRSLIEVDEKIFQAIVTALF